MAALFAAPSRKVDLRQLYFNAPAPPRALQAPKQTLAGYVNEAVAGLGRKAGLSRSMAKKVATLADLSAVGNVASAFDAGAQIRGGDWLGGGLGALLAIAPIPGPERAAGKPFAKWFAGSKIVDRQGAPMIVYHGTKSDFDAFDMKHFGAGDEGLLGKGFYFTYNPEEASSYALRDMYGKGDSPNVVPAYLSIQNPLTISGGRLPDGRHVRELHGGGINSKGGNAVRQMAEDAGHDGIIWTTNDGGIGHAVAFRPEQIKSALGNRGTYDPANLAITK